MNYLKPILLILVLGAFFAGCASKFDQASYDRQNKAAEKSQNSL